MDTLERLLLDEQGATAIEYALIAAAIALLSISAFALFGQSLEGKFSYVGESVTNASPPP
jgi:Flp pilus assembly pilin Flp